MLWSQGFELSDTVKEAISHCILSILFVANIEWFNCCTLFQFTSLDIFKILFGSLDRISRNSKSRWVSCWTWWALTTFCKWDLVCLKFKKNQIPLHFPILGLWSICQVEPGFRQEYKWRLYVIAIANCKLFSWLKIAMEWVGWKIFKWEKNHFINDHKETKQDDQEFALSHLP